MPFADLATDIAFSPNVSPRNRAAPCALPPHPTGPGWFESSFELAAGLEIREGWPGDAPLDAWLDAFLRQPASGAFAALAAPATSSPLSLSAR